LALALLVLAIRQDHGGLRRFMQKASAFSATPAGSLVIAIACAYVFFLLRNEFVNEDGRHFLARFLEDIPTKGAHVTHDEMWELYIHSKVWSWANTHFGWSVIQTYQRLSVVAGGIFVFILLRLCLILDPTRPFALFLCVTAAGYMQLFFGDVENYTLTAVLVTAYIFAAIAHLQGRIPVTWPSAVLGLAITFHLLAGFLIPSLVYLWWSEGRRHGWRALGPAVALFAGIIFVTLVFFHYNHLPISALFYQSHAFGHGGHILLMLARPSLPYYWQQLNLIILLFPPFLLMLPLLIYRRIPWNPTNVFLGLATASLLVFQLSWNAQLGVYNDWNLFAMPAIPLSILVWSNFFTNVMIARKAEVAVLVVGLAGMHSFAWILSNRLYGFL
jgi:hypothetical protein